MAAVLQRLGLSSLKSAGRIGRRGTAAQSAAERKASALATTGAAETELNVRSIQRLPAIGNDVSNTAGERTRTVNVQLGRLMLYH